MVWAPRLFYGILDVEDAMAFVICRTMFFRNSDVQ